MKRSSIFIAFGVIVLLLAAGITLARGAVLSRKIFLPIISKGPLPTPTPTATPNPTDTPTATPNPSNTPTLAATPNPSNTPTPTIADPVVVTAGDIADCASNGDEATALLLDQIDGTVVTLGDNAYPSGSASEFANCYDPTWGRHKVRTYPSPGNHEYYTANASAYFEYFGARAGAPSQGYYSFDLGAWHLIALNSELAVNAGSAQEQWLRADLAAHPTTCTLAYWHKPRFSSGPHGSNANFQALWQALYDYGADVALNGHDHDYERFAPQMPDGTLDAARGIREFVVGTGGVSLYGFVTIAPNSEVRDSATYGVLKLTLHAASYDWQFAPVASTRKPAFTDAGTAVCH